MDMKLGDSVIVKQGVKEPSCGEFEIGGWQGRVIEIDTASDEEDFLITIEWDSLTLRQIPPNYIIQSELDGLDWSSMVLCESELEKTKSRFQNEKVEQVQDELYNKYFWNFFGEQGIRISKVLDDASLNNEIKYFEKWAEHLDKELTFPIQATVSDTDNNRKIKDGDEVLIKSLTQVVDVYGIIAKIVFKGREYQFPLCDLKVIDSTSPNFELIDDYRVWFANI